MQMVISLSFAVYLLTLVAHGLAGVQAALVTRHIANIVMYFRPCKQFDHQDPAHVVCYSLLACQPANKSEIISLLPSHDELGMCEASLAHPKPSL